MQADIAYLNQVHTGALVSRCLYDTGQVIVAVSSAVVGIARDVLMFGLLTGLMLYRDWQLALLTFIVLPLLGLGIGKIGRGTRRAAAAILEKTAELTTILTEALDGVRLVKVFATEGHETERTRAAVERRRRVIMRLVRIRACTAPLTEVVGGIAIALTILFGAWRVEQGDLTLGALGSFVTALVMCYRPLRRLARLNAQVQEGLAAAQRIDGVLRTQPRVVDAPGARPLRLAGGTVRFEDVRFSYDGTLPVIDGVSFAIPGGKVIALVGPSGAGKSTLVNLIPRLYDATAGRVTVDGTDVRDATLASLRESVAVVSQEVTLFDDTVRANIAYGRPAATDEEVAAVARAAAADGFIDALPQGYQTVVGERGVKLSGGQRQRIAVARAMLRDAPILLLDEATSSLDSQSEHLVKLALGRLMKGRTTLIVAHRLSTVIDADEIHVLVAGRIVESGSHAALLARGGVYARLYSIQAAEDSLDAAGTGGVPRLAGQGGAGQ
jgi:subfamily B ATP-binding cassette protein MsbA